jgi:hypothetical protein
MEKSNSKGMRINFTGSFEIFCTPATCPNHMDSSQPRADGWFSYQTHMIMRGRENLQSPMSIVLLPVPFQYLQANTMGNYKTQ